MTDSLSNLGAVFAAGVLVGLWIGQRATSARWARNADQIWRIECRGRLFKVLHDGDYTSRVMRVIEENKKAGTAHD